LAGQIVPEFEYEPDLTKESCDPELWKQLTEGPGDIAVKWRAWRGPTCGLIQTTIENH